MLESLQTFLENYPIIAPIIFILVRTIPIIVPLIPGLILDLMALAIFPWFIGFFYAMIAVLIASTISFFVGRYFRDWVTKKFKTIQEFHEWENQLSEHRKFVGLVVLRFTTFPYFDYVNYAAGITHLRYSYFFWATLIGTAPIMLAVYYFGDIIFRQTLFVVALFVMLFFVGYFIYSKEGTL